MVESVKTKTADHEASSGMYDGPPTCADRKPSRPISIRLSADERAKLEARASSAGLGLSTYLKEAAMSAADRRRLPHNTARDGIARQLAAICGEMVRIAAFCDGVRQSAAFQDVDQDNRLSDQAGQLERISTELASLLSVMIELRDGVKAARQT